MHLDLNARPAGVIRVLLVDRCRLVLWALEQLIERSRPALEVVGTASDLAAAIERAALTRPDVVVLDTELVDHEAPSEIPSLINGRAARVLLLSSTHDSAAHEAAILRGACGVVHKDEPPELLVKAIAKVHKGELWLDRSTTGRIFVELSRRKPEPAVDPARREFGLLTARELAVVGLLVRMPGAANKTLAASLNIGEHTLRNHLSRIYEKLDVPNRLQLYVLAQRAGVSGAMRRDASAAAQSTA